MPVCLVTLHQHQACWKKSPIHSCRWEWEGDVSSYRVTYASLISYFYGDYFPPPKLGSKGLSLLKCSFILNCTMKFCLLILRNLVYWWSPITTPTDFLKHSWLPMNHLVKSFLSLSLFSEPGDKWPKCYFKTLCFCWVGFR